MSQQAMRVFSTAFKESAVLRLAAGERLAEVARELGIARKLLYEWRGAYRKLGAAGLNRRRGPKPMSARARPDAAPATPAPLSELARAQARSPSSNARSASRRSTSIFSRSLVSHRRAGPFARRHLRGHPSDERAGYARRLLDPAFVRARRRFARRLLSSRQVVAPERTEADLRDQRCSV